MGNIQLDKFAMVIIPHFSKACQPPFTNSHKLQEEEIAEKLKTTKRTVERNIQKLRGKNKLKREGSAPKVYGLLYNDF